MEGFSIDFFLFRYKWSLLLLQMHYRCFSWLSVLYTFWLLLNHIYSILSLKWFSLTASFELFQDSAFTALFIFGFICLQIAHIETYRPYRKCDFPQPLLTLLSFMKSSLRFRSFRFFSLLNRYCKLWWILGIIFWFCEQLCRHIFHIINECNLCDYVINHAYYLVSELAVCR